ncbi:MAG: SMP-30/gluconolactonase/LRE family protein [Bacteroidota bacterium]
MKNIFLIIALMLSSLMTKAQHINFESNELYPEGIAYSKKLKKFFVSSIHYGKIGTVDLKGNYSEFVDDEELVSSLGLLIDEKKNLLIACVADPGVSVKTDQSTQGKLAKLIAYHLKTGKKAYSIDLAAINKSSGNFANDLAMDKAGNIYITNSFSPVVFKVTAGGKASIFATSDHWDKEGFSLNGIAFHEDGSLIVSQSNTGALYTVSLKDPKNIQKINVNEMPGADGIILSKSNELIVLSNSEKTLYKVTSNDNWQSANIAATVPSLLSFPTTGVNVNSKNFVLNAKLNEIFDPATPNSSDYIIQEVTF